MGHRTGVPLTLFALPDAADETNRFAIDVPLLGSLILTHSLDGEVKGLKSFKPEDRPPVAIPFFAFRVMVGIGTLMLALVASPAGRRRKRPPAYLCMSVAPHFSIPPCFRHAAARTARLASAPAESQPRKERRRRRLHLLRRLLAHAHGLIRTPGPAIP